MSDMKHVVEEISAYLDNEVDSRDRARIEEHLRGCKPCAQHYHQIRAVTTQVRSLRGPEVRPEFVTRVLARVRDESQDIAWWQRWLPSFAAQRPALVGATLAAFAVGFVAVVVYKASPAPEANAPVQIASIVPEITLPQEALTAVGVIDELVDAGIDTELLAEYAEGDNADTLNEDEASDAIADEVINTEFLAMLDAGWANADDDVYADIDTMTTDEQAELQELLQGGYYDNTGYEGYAP